MPTPRSAVGVGVVGVTLYAVGGVDDRGTPSRAVEAFDPYTDSWIPRAPMSTARYGFGIGVVNDIVYVAGGMTASGMTDAVEAYDPATDTWSARASLPSSTAFLAAAGLGGFLYAVGGQRPDSTTLATVLAYDPATDRWSSRPSMPTARSQMGIGVSDGQLYVMAGATPGDSSDAAWSTVAVFDPATDRWTTAVPSGFGTNYRYSGAPRFPAIAVLPGTGVLMLGGSDGASSLGDPYAIGSVYDPVQNRYSAFLRVPIMAHLWEAGLASAGVVNGELYLVGYQTYRFIP